MSKLQNFDTDEPQSNWTAAFQHPLDRMFLKRLDRSILSRLAGWYLDRQVEEEDAFQSGGGVLVTKDSMPNVHAAFAQACSRLGFVPENFKLFIEANPLVNAYCCGSNTPLIVATSGLINNCSPEEMTFVFGHEIGHYMCGHMRNQYLADRLIWISGQFKPLLAATTFTPTLMAWSRYAEHSADRAGLIACGNFNHACAGFLRMGGFPVSQELPKMPRKVLMDQVCHYDQTTGKMNMLRRLRRELSYSMSSTHPRTLERFCDMAEWVDSGAFDELAEASPRERAEIAKSIGDDPMKNDLLLFCISELAEYLSQEKKMNRMESLKALRKAILRNGTLKGTSLEFLLRIEMSVKRDGTNKLDYALHLFMPKQNDRKTLVKASFPMEYNHDWDFASQELRNEFIMGRKKEVRILLYQS